MLVGIDYGSKLAGTTVIAVGLALFVLDLYRKSPDTWWLPLLSIASLQSLPRLFRVLIFMGLCLVIGLALLAAKHRGENVEETAGDDSNPVVATTQLAPSFSRAGA